MDEEVAQREHTKEEEEEEEDKESACDDLEDAADTDAADELLLEALLRENPTFSREVLRQLLHAMGPTLLHSMLNSSSEEVVDDNESPAGDVEAFARAHRRGIDARRSFGSVLGEHGGSCGYCGRDEGGFSLYVVGITTPFSHLECCVSSPHHIVTPAPSSSPSSSSPQFALLYAVLPTPLTCVHCRWHFVHPLWLWSHWTFVFRVCCALFPPLLLSFFALLRFISVVTALQATACKPLPAAVERGLEAVWNPVVFAGQRKVLLCEGYHSFAAACISALQISATTPQQVPSSAGQPLLSSFHWWDCCCYYPYYYRYYYYYYYYYCNNYYDYYDHFFFCNNIIVIFHIIVILSQDLTSATGKCTLVFLASEWVCFACECMCG
jgi:hypothetical protein